VTSSSPAPPHLALELLDWFDREGRDWPWRHTRDRWVVLVSEVCSQQTQIARAAVFIEAILDRFPTAAEFPLLAERAWHWGSAVMELGQTSCRARALCNMCPVRELCPSAGTDEVIASPRQKQYAGSMRQRRGALLRAITDHGHADFGEDVDAAESLIKDGLARQSGNDGELLLPP
jgi:adenine-specific DNA glycosylase